MGALLVSCELPPPASRPPPLSWTHSYVTSSRQFCTAKTRLVWLELELKLGALANGGHQAALLFSSLAEHKCQRSVISHAPPPLLQSRFRLSRSAANNGRPASLSNSYNKFAPAIRLATVSGALDVARSLIKFDRSIDATRPRRCHRHRHRPRRSAGRHAKDEVYLWAQSSTGHAQTHTNKRSF